MHYRLLILLIFTFAVNPSLAFANKVENLFQESYHQLLGKVANASPIFGDPVSVEQAIKSQDGKDRVKRLKKRIAVTRMLVADGQLQSEKKISFPFVQMTASQLIKAGEKWVLIAQAQTDEGKEEEEQKCPEKEGTVETKEVEGGTGKPQEEVIIIEKKRRDNRFDIFDDDEFNLFDILAFPFRLIGMILELLFNILLFPFKLLSKILF